MSLLLLLDDEYGRSAFCAGVSLDDFIDNGSDSFTAFKQGFLDEQRKATDPSSDGYDCVSIKIFE